MNSRSFTEGVHYISTDKQPNMQPLKQHKFVLKLTRIKRVLQQHLKKSNYIYIYIYKKHYLLTCGSTLRCVFLE